MNNEQMDLLIDSASAALSELAEAGLEAASTSVSALAFAGGGPAAAVAAVGITLISAKTKRYFSNRGKQNKLSVHIDNCITVLELDMHQIIPDWCKSQVSDIIQQTELKAEDLVNRPSYIAEITNQAGKQYSGEERELVTRICSLVWSSLAIAIRKTEAYQQALEVKCHVLSRKNNNIENDLYSLWQSVNYNSREIGKIKDEIESIKQKPDNQRSFARIIDNYNPKRDNSNPFHFRNNIIPFVGRRKELKILQGFLDDGRDLLWMSITGEGGAGKSKLLYHFEKKLENDPAWKVVWVSRNFMASIKTIMEYNEWDYPYNLLFIADYASEISDELGEWIEGLSEATIRPVKLRFALLEREPANTARQTITPIWLIKFMGSNRRKRCLEEFHYEDIELRGLIKDEYLKVIRDFVSHEHNRDLSEIELQTILDTTRKLDSHNPLPRILLVILVADAFIRDPGFSNWNVEKLVENVIDRYKDHWKAVIDKAFNSQEADLVMKSLLDMLLFATATGRWNPAKEDTALLGPFAESATRIANLEIRGTIFSMVNYAPEEIDILYALEPDLIGECYVLMILREKYYQNKKIYAAIIESLWENQYYFDFFIRRCIENYYNNGTFSVLFNEALEPLLPRVKTIRNETYSILLSTLLSFQFGEEEKKTIVKLEEIATAHVDCIIAVNAYAKGLIRRAENQPEEVAKILERLEDFVTSQAPFNNQIPGIYVDCLIELAEKLPKRAKETISRLEDFLIPHEDDFNLNYAYMRGLIKLAESLPQKREGILRRLEEFLTVHIDNVVFNCFYVSSLLELAETQPKIAAEIIHRLEKYVTSHGDDMLINYYYIDRLIELAENLPEKAVEIIDMLEEFVASHAENEKIITSYVEGIIQLAERHPEKASETLSRLEKFVLSHAENKSITASYVEGIIQLAENLPIESAQIINRFEDFITSNVENKDTIAEYVVGLINLAKNQPEEEANKTMKRLERFVISHANNDLITSIYILALIGLEKDQPKEEANKTMKRLEQFVTFNTNTNNNIPKIYVMSIIDHAEDHPEIAEETLSRLERFVTFNVDNERISVAYVSALISLAERQSEEKAQKTMTGLERFVNTHIKNYNVTGTYIGKLLSLAKRQPEGDAKKTMKRLESFVIAHADNDSIPFAYFNCLRILLENSSDAELLFEKMGFTVRGLMAIMLKVFSSKIASLFIKKSGKHMD